VARQVTLNGKTFWAAEFDGVDDYLQNTGSALGAASAGVARLTLIVIGAATNSAGTTLRYSASIAQGGSSNVGYARTSLGVSRQNSDAGTVIVRRIDNVESSLDVSSVAGTMGTGWHVWQGQSFYDQNRAALLRDGVEVAASSLSSVTAAGVTSNTPSNGFSIGASIGGGSIYKGLIAEVLVYAGDTTPTAPIIDSYVQDNYGIAVADYGLQLAYTVSDASGINDNGPQSLRRTHRRVATDRGSALTDTQNAFIPRALAATATDGVGLADPFPVERWIAGTLTDPVGLADTTTINGAGNTAVAETAGVTDSVQLTWSRPRTVTDGLGITDVGFEGAVFTLTVTDGVAVVDGGVKRDFARIANDTTGLTDSTTYLRALVRAPVTDSTGITDTASRSTVQGRVVTDRVGLTDPAASRFEYPNAEPNSTIRQPLEGYAQPLLQDGVTATIPLVVEDTARRRGEGTARVVYVADATAQLADEVVAAGTATIIRTTTQTTEGTS